jgi:hypothetical protein
VARGGAAGGRRRGGPGRGGRLAGGWEGGGGKEQIVTCVMDGMVGNFSLNAVKSGGYQLSHLN